MYKVCCLCETKIDDGLEPNTEDTSDFFFVCDKCKNNEYVQNRRQAMKHMLSRMFQNTMAKLELTAREYPIKQSTVWVKNAKEFLDNEFCVFCKNPCGKTDTEYNHCMIDCIDEVAKVLCEEHNMEVNPYDKTSMKVCVKKSNTYCDLCGGRIGYKDWAGSSGTFPVDGRRYYRVINICKMCLRAGKHKKDYPDKPFLITKRPETPVELEDK